MLFSTPLFLFVFLPLAVLFYQAVPAPWRNMAILLISVLFYAWGEPRFVFVVLISALDRLRVGAATSRVAALDPGLPGARHRRQPRPAVRLQICRLRACAGLQPLFGEHAVPRARPAARHFLRGIRENHLPGRYPSQDQSSPRRTSWTISSSSSCSRRCWRVRSSNTAISHRRCDSGRRPWTTSFSAFRRFLWGLAKKVLIADVCGEVADAVFGLSPTALGFATAWAGVLAFTVQIYFDFSGYSDMAIGIARMFGFRLRENFDHPYGAGSRSPSSGAAGIFRCPPGSATISTSRSAATAVATCAPTSISGSVSCCRAFGTAPIGLSSPGVPTMVAS